MANWIDPDVLDGILRWLVLADGSVLEYLFMGLLDDNDDEVTGSGYGRVNGALSTLLSGFPVYWFDIDACTISGVLLGGSTGDPVGTFDLDSPTAVGDGDGAYVDDSNFTLDIVGVSGTLYSYAETQIINHLQGLNWPLENVRLMALYDETDTEITGGDYERTFVAQEYFADPSGGSVANNVEFAFNGMPACTVKSWRLSQWSEPNRDLIGDDFPTPIVVGAGQVFTIPVGAIAISLEAGP